MGTEIKVTDPSLPASMRQNAKGMPEGTTINKDNILSFTHAAEGNHRPEEGYFSGLDAKEIETITKVAPEKAGEYKRLAESKINAENLKADKLHYAKKVQYAQREYEKAQIKSGNSFTRFFKSDADIKKAQQQVERTKRELEFAQTEYTGMSSNVISYETLLQRNGGEDIK